jgi:hypothetical protein
MSSSTFGYTVYAVITAMAIVWGVFTHVRPARSATLDDVVTRMTRHPILRWSVYALWAFMGWHLFVRGSGAFK